MLDLALTGAYCSQHPAASRCSPNSFPAELAAILIVAVIVALALLSWVWKRQAGGDHPPARLGRLANTVMARLVRK